MVGIIVIDRPIDASGEPMNSATQMEPIEPMFGMPVQPLTGHESHGVLSVEPWRSGVPIDTVYPYASSVRLAADYFPPSVSLGRPRSFAATLRKAVTKASRSGRSISETAA